MSYKTILVQADLSRHAAARIRIAANLAREHGAHLIGAAATGVSRDLFPNGYHAKPGTLEASYFEPLHAAAAQALERFGEIAGAAGVSFERRLLCDRLDDGMALLARFSDLVVLSQDDPAEALASTPDRTPEYVVLTCARPVLLAPCAAAPEHVGRNILLAWDGSREASAAMRAALPLLQGAARVSVVCFCDSRGKPVCDAREQADLAAFLKRHAVQPAILAPATGIDGGRALLALAARDGHDLVVMGCYGHSQFRELFLGGVTRTVLRDATLPVLMAR
ncbi:universal stress protein [Massilia niastensis]|uniref:universal stress protein n=1 Tax=Massilia niastensis TaxID=544911 RepID=UPI0003638202|nr:universal stress protein [Massilia niastensis]